MFSGKQKDVYGVPEEAQTVREATTKATQGERLKRITDLNFKRPYR